MKLRLILVAVLFSVLSVLTTSCGTDANKCDTLKCAAYETCDKDKEACVLNDGSCAADTDCATNDYCDMTTHTCQSKSCQNKCLDAAGLSKGECSLVAGKPVCECDAGYEASPNNVYCHEIPAECNEGGDACSGHGKCKATNETETPFECECDTDYVISADGLECEETSYCSNSNHAGTCTKSCEKCIETDGNWSCKVPAGDRPCDGAFNDQCDPAGDGSDCESGWCEGETDNGYCTSSTCLVDSDCITTYGDQFVCMYYGEGFIGICHKADDACFAADGTRLGGGAEGDACSDSCLEADCNAGLICLGGTCSKQCSGPLDETCEEGRGCIDLTGGQGGSRLYYCNKTVELGADCSDGSACVEDGWCLSAGGPSYCFGKCTVAAAASDECGGEECVDFGNGLYCEPAPTKTEGEVCDIANACADNGWCLGSGEGDSYCFNECSAAAAASDECGGQECVAFGTAPNNGFYCEIAPNKSVGEECDLVNTCLNDGWCLSAGDTPSICFDSCTVASEASSECPGEEACVAFGVAPNNGFYCNPSIPKTQNFGEECSLAADCVDGLVCISSPSSEASHCFYTCEVADDPTTCNAGSTCTALETIAFCQPECMGDADCTVAGEVCNSSFECVAP